MVLLNALEMFLREINRGDFDDGGNNTPVWERNNIW